CEALLSSVTGSEDTVLTSSGFSAGQMAVGRKPVINAPGSHPAILKERSGHPSFADWAEWVVAGVNNGRFSGPVATDSLSPLSATLNHFGFLTGIQKDLDVIVDDSHGIGIIGDGKGISALVPRSGHLNYTFTYSLSKAFGIPGGAVSCSAEEGARLRGLAAYTAVTPQSPGLLYAFTKGQPVYSRQLAKLRGNIAQFSEAVADLPGISGHPELPVFILNQDYREEDLYEHGIIISSFAYPDPNGTRLNRIVLNALHSGTDLERLSDALHLISRQK
ncbi:MAG TPA: aminotransferase class I/II-fold pyridoxal phosphate-dependent enzyme, partial [Sphingobacteriaceae bacterium]